MSTKESGSVSPKTEPTEEETLVGNTVEDIEPKSQSVSTTAEKVLQPLAPTERTEKIKAALKRQDFCPIPREEFQKVNDRVKPHLERFVHEFFPDGYYSNQETREYWVSPEFGLRISLTNGGFWDLKNPKQRNPGGDPVLLWVLLHANGTEISKREWLRLIKSLHAWCDKAETSPELTEYQRSEIIQRPKREAVKVLYALLFGENKTFEYGKYSAKVLWYYVIHEFGKLGEGARDEALQVPEFSNGPAFKRFLMELYSKAQELRKQLASLRRTHPNYPAASLPWPLILVERHTKGKKKEFFTLRAGDAPETRLAG
jgi:hypothetical protein